ncbi:Cytochrome P450 [Glarea lozoyensis ATCC 20868]|uniref:Cytochrome P450 n=1 Tax=Glarea lozoyensis (strain ATCC 20868 / MF5171) TaxID=1116229 RepID=S3EFR5_GLAL2|nr:Cytochrome P450 [Glarea lozoyensis ATCC 20868]EPE37028.1 Cytochrome P450 [Glarea lozoyensis ATCC 20868]
MENGVFTDDGQPWRHARALIRPTFTRFEITDLEYFKTFVERFLALFPRDGSEFDMLPLAKRLFLDTSSEFILGQSVNSLLPTTPPEELEFIESFDHCLTGLALRLVAGPLRPLFKLDPTFKPNYQKVHKFVDKNVHLAIERARKLQAAGKTGEEEEEGVKKKCILLHQMAMENQDAAYLRAQTLNVFFPARDTSALAIGNIVFELARHIDC